MSRSERRPHVWPCRHCGMVDDYRLLRDTQLRAAERPGQDEDYQLVTFKDWLRTYQWEQAPDTATDGWDDSGWDETGWDETGWERDTGGWGGGSAVDEPERAAGVAVPHQRTRATVADHRFGFAADPVRVARDSVAAIADPSHDHLDRADVYRSLADDQDTYTDDRLTDDIADGRTGDGVTDDVLALGICA